jgi:hypothetical protein
MSSLFETSSVSIIALADVEPGVQIVEYKNPEVILPRLIQQYLQDFDISNIHPNFPVVRVGNTHPFVMLLNQEMNNAQFDLSLFPSITVIDNSTSQIAMEIGNSRSVGVIRNDDDTGIWLRFKKSILDGAFLTSPQNLITIESELSVKHVINYISTGYITSSAVDINIWSENKDYTSELYDITKQYFIDNKTVLDINYGLQLVEGINGRRSGDINLDFGKILYGANITVPLNIQHHSYSFDVTDVLIKSVELASPTYHEV